MSINIKNLLFGQTSSRSLRGIKLKLVTASPEEPVTVAHMKDVLHIINVRYDAKLTRVIKASRFLVEKLSGKVMVDQTWTQIHDTPSQIITINKTPVSSITTVKYYPTIDATAQTTVASSKYFLVGDILTSREGWEGTRGIQGFEITFVAGYGATAELVASNGDAYVLLQATEMIAAYLFENPGDLVQVDAVNSGSGDRAGLRSLPPEALSMILSEVAWEL